MAFPFCILIIFKYTRFICLRVSCLFWEATSSGSSNKTTFFFFWNSYSLPAQLQLVVRLNAACLVNMRATLNVTVQKCSAIPITPRDLWICFKNVNHLEDKPARVIVYHFLEGFWRAKKNPQKNIGDRTAMPAANWDPPASSPRTPFKVTARELHHDIRVESISSNTKWIFSQVHWCAVIMMRVHNLARIQCVMGSKALCVCVCVCT